MVRDLLANAGDAGSVPASGRYLEKEMATHSSTLAWRIPWTEEPGGLHSPWDHKSQSYLAIKQQGVGIHQKPYEVFFSLLFCF